MPAQTQAANDSGGTFVDQQRRRLHLYLQDEGSDQLSTPTVTTSIGVSAFRDLSAYGTFDEWSEVGNDVFNFVPNGTAVKVRGRL